jgi:chemotaxis regulatin CheY-phosphate phosphatase CheZ
MPGRGKLSARSGGKGRASAKRADNGRSVSDEITVLVNTLRELAAIRSTAEDAAGRILDSAEGLLAFADQEEAKKAEEAILSIMTACGFHDLVGQRVTKITESLDKVLATRMSAAGKSGKHTERPAKATKAKLTLDGPGLPESSQDQARIDALFRDN